MTKQSTDIYKDMVRVDTPEAQVHLHLTSQTLPLALSIELPGGYVSEVVPSNVRLPHVTKKLFSTAGSFQLAAEFHILLGNRPLARDNISLCRIRVRNIKWSGAGVPQIELQFQIDTDGRLTVSATNLDRDNAEIIVFMTCTEVTAEDIERAIKNAQSHNGSDTNTRTLIQKMLDSYALIGTTNDYYSAAKKKMGHHAKRAYKQSRSRLEKALSVDVADANEDTITELDAALAVFRDQRQILLPLYKQVMDWYS